MYEEGILVYRELKEKIVKVNLVIDMVIIVKVIIGEGIVNLARTYAYFELEDGVKNQF